MRKLTAAALVLSLVLGIAASPAMSFAARARRVDGTLVVRVFEEEVDLCHEGCKLVPEESQVLRISKLSPSGEVASSIETKSHTISVVPGRYEIGLSKGLVDTYYTPKHATVHRGETVKVTLQCFVE